MIICTMYKLVAMYDHGMMYKHCTSTLHYIIQGKKRRLQCTSYYVQVRCTRNMYVLQVCTCTSSTMYLYIPCTSYRNSAWLLVRCTMYLVREHRRATRTYQYYIWWVRCTLYLVLHSLVHVHSTCMDKVNDVLQGRANMSRYMYIVHRCTQWLYSSTM